MKTNSFERPLLHNGTITMQIKLMTQCFFIDTTFVGEGGFSTE